jgi:hypothetical protein
MNIDNAIWMMKWAQSHLGHWYHHRHCGCGIYAVDSEWYRMQPGG